MNFVEDLLDLDYPTRARAGESLGTIWVKLGWAGHELVSYTQTEDVADLLEVERVLQEIRTEIAHAEAAIRKEIHCEDEKISQELAIQSQEREGGRYV